MGDCKGCARYQQTYVPGLCAGGAVAPLVRELCAGGAVASLIPELCAVGSKPVEIGNILHLITSGDLTFYLT